MKTDIVLATLNARYIHSAFGLRYLKANLGEFESKTRICEFNLEQRPLDVAEQILALQPRIVGLGIYIWNAEKSVQLAALIKRIAPQVILVVGGPEVSYEQQTQPVCQLADYVLSGPAEGQFHALCSALLNGRPVGDYAAAGLTLDAIRLPYYLYSEEDIANRVIYVEASRGCPFKCEFCLSALDKTARAFPLEPFLLAMDRLYQRGARHFKFVDRTFNLNIRVSVAILEFFLERVLHRQGQDELFLHYEVIPDRLPEALKNIISRFPAGSLQFEVGVQTFNPEVQAIIQRKQDNLRSEQNLAWLARQTAVHIHSDLIFGLPGETLQSMARSFDKLVALRPHEIQLGILKRLRGMPMLEKAEQYALVFNPNPPYEILSTSEIDFVTMQRLRRMARYWDLVANSGRFRVILDRVLGEAPFERFMRLSDWLHQTTGQTHKISLQRLFDLLYQALIEEFAMDKDTVRGLLREDYARSGQKGLPVFLRQAVQKQAGARVARGNRRQQTHNHAGE